VVKSLTLCCSEEVMSLKLVLRLMFSACTLSFSSATEGVTMSWTRIKNEMNIVSWLNEAIK